MSLYPAQKKELTNATQYTGENFRRSHETMEFIRFDAKNGEIRANLPIGRGWNRDGSPIEWINLGWEIASEYDARKNSEQAAAKREAAGAGAGAGAGKEKK